MNNREILWYWNQLPGPHSLTLETGHVTTLWLNISFLHISYHSNGNHSACNTILTTSPAHRVWEAPPTMGQTILNNVIENVSHAWMSVLNGCPLLEMISLLFGSYSMMSVLHSDKYIPSQPNIPSILGRSFKPLRFQSGSQNQSLGRRLSLFGHCRFFSCPPKSRKLFYVCRNP